MRNIHTEFPEFDLSTLPKIPEGFEDASWRNDAMPNFINHETGLYVWVDFENPELSEFPEWRKSGEMKRFLLMSSSQKDESGFVQFTDEDVVILASDNWADIEKAIKEEELGK